MGKVTIRETLARQNFRGVLKKPDWYDEGVRTYGGITITARGESWPEIVTCHDGNSTVAYLTRHGFDLTRRGPELKRVYSEQACHRRLVREVFRDHGMDVEFA